MNWKVESRGGRGAVPTRDETNVHRPYTITRFLIRVNRAIVNMYYFAICG